MKNYFNFLTTEEQIHLEANRFDGIEDPILYKKIADNLQVNYDIVLNYRKRIRIPTNHQITAFRQMYNNAYEGLFMFAEFMEQGLGKTKLSLMICDWLYRVGRIDGVIVISPNDLKYQWMEEELGLHFPHDCAELIWEGMTTQIQRKTYSEFVAKDCIRFFAINVEAFSSATPVPYIDMFLKKCTDVVIIIDESTTIKGGRRRPSGKGIRKGAKRSNVILDLFADRMHKLILTGTATPNRPFDLWSQFEFLKFNYFKKDYWDFCKLYGEMIQVRRANAKTKSLDLLDEKTYNLVKSDIAYHDIGTCSHREDCMTPLCAHCDKEELKELTVAIMEDIALARGLTESAVKRIHKMEEFNPYKDLDGLKSAIAPVTFFCKTEEVIDLPGRVYVPLYSRMSSEQSKIYKTMEQEMMVEFEGDTLSTIYKQVMYLRCQQIAGGLFPYPVEVIKQGLTSDDYRILTSYKTKPIPSCGKLANLSTHLDDVDPDQSRIFWAFFMGEQDLIYRMLCDKYGSHKVGLYRGDNKKSVEQAFKAKEISCFVSGDAGAYGLNLQVSHNQYHYSNNHKGDVRDQKEKRSDRMGQKFPVTINDCICKGTKDNRVLKVLKSKLDLMDFFRSGSEI